MVIPALGEANEKEQSEMFSDCVVLCILKKGQAEFLLNSNTFHLLINFQGQERPLVSALFIQIVASL